MYLYWRKQFSSFRRSLTNGEFTSRKYSVKAPAQGKISIFVLMEICYQLRKRLCPWPWLLLNHHKIHLLTTYLFCCTKNLKYTIFVPFVRNFKGFVNDKLAICLVNSLPLFTEVVWYCLVQCQKNSYHDLRLRLYTFRPLYLPKYLVIFGYSTYH